MSLKRQVGGSPSRPSACAKGMLRKADAAPAGDDTGDANAGSMSGAAGRKSASVRHPVSALPSGCCGIILVGQSGLMLRVVVGCGARHLRERERGIGPWPAPASHSVAELQVQGGCRRGPRLGRPPM